MIDLRKKKIVAVNIKPNDSRQKNFNLALAEYLYKEFKKEGLNPKKRNLIVNVDLCANYQNKYSSVIVDCLDGKIYLRGKEVKDKYFGKLRRFEGQRTSDAYHCVAQSAARIINRIRKLNKELETGEKEVLGEIEKIDLRKPKLNDLRKTLKNEPMVKLTDLRKRKTLCSIKQIDLRSHKNYALKDLRKNVVAVKDVNSELKKESFLDFRKNKSPYKNNRSHDFSTRDYAILYINGFIYNSNTHAKAINLFLRDNGLKEIDETYFRPILDSVFYSSTKDEEIAYYLKEHISKLAFAHMADDETTIYLETDTLYGVSKEEVAHAIRLEFPGMPIFDDNKYDPIRETYVKIAKNLKCLSRLIESDVYDWVKERAEHLMDVADMESGMAYGVAWIQWRKKHPNWKSKEEKEEMKTKGSLNKNSGKQVGTIYHFTTIEGLKGILTSNKLIGNEDSYGMGISFSRSKNLWYAESPIRIEVNGDHLSDNYKIKPFNYNQDIAEFLDDNGRGESEERVFSGEINNFKSYIERISISKYIINKRNIRYEIEKNPFMNPEYKYKVEDVVEIIKNIDPQIEINVEG